jgi:hypothetical protein
VPIGSIFSVASAEAVPQQQQAAAKQGQSDAKQEQADAKQRERSRSGKQGFMHFFIQHGGWKSGGCKRRSKSAAIGGRAALAFDSAEALGGIDFIRPQAYTALDGGTALELRPRTMAASRPVFLDGCEDSRWNWRATEYARELTAS